MNDKEKLDWYINRDSQLIEVITNGLSKSNYTLEVLLEQYRANNISVNELGTIFDDIINCELEGDDLIKYLKQIYEQWYIKLKKVDCEYLLTFDELVEKLLKVGKL